jgi:hypothetical protein
MSKSGKGQLTIVPSNHSKEVLTKRAHRESFPIFACLPEEWMTPLKITLPIICKGSIVFPIGEATFTKARDHMTIKEAA